ncbi:hypothetical protein EGR_10540 [Echinococcus granulosus]|uniref:Uncharacterized protein n=1 Tax=Echinococcus granulosus TaxID=6210 RepID=W6U880_ECHGR|nr:hypothetical protein EGR_10540 [Echinococcus granulosus]EUB54602.1 hypothetical protein EGR_10540 [Echinococcus granulosus]
MKDPNLKKTQLFLLIITSFSQPKLKNKIIDSNQISLSRVMEMNCLLQNQTKGKDLNGQIKSAIYVALFQKENIIWKDLGCPKLACQNNSSECNKDNCGTDYVGSTYEISNHACICVH